MQLSLAHDLFYPDNDVYKDVIHVQQLLGEIYAKHEFVQELRTKRQKQKLFQPRLFVCYDSAVDHWIPEHFDGQDNEPMESSNCKSQKQEIEEAKNKQSQIPEESSNSQKPEIEEVGQKQSRK